MRQGERVVFKKIFLYMPLYVVFTFESYKLPYLFKLKLTLKIKKYRTDFWTLWEKGRVGCFKRIACILSIVKQITSPGGMHETSAPAWCTGKTQRDWVEREGGGGIRMVSHVTPWLIHVNVWQNPLKCEVISLQLIKINEKKKQLSIWKTKKN